MSEHRELYGKELDPKVLSNLILIKRTDRPDEWGMDELSRMAFELEKENAELKKERDELEKLLDQAEDNQREAEIDLEVLVNIVPQKYLDEATGERANR